MLPQNADFPVWQNGALRSPVALFRTREEPSLPRSYDAVLLLARFGARMMEMMAKIMAVL